MRAESVSSVSPGKDRNLPLQHDRARVGALVHEVDRAARLRLARLERPPLGVEARELREQRRMDVQDPAPPPRDELRREEPHVARQADEVGPRLVEDRAGSRPRAARLDGSASRSTAKAGSPRSLARASPRASGDVGDDRDDLGVRDRARARRHRRSPRSSSRGPERRIARRRMLQPSQFQVK